MTIKIPVFTPLRKRYDWSNSDAVLKLTHNKFSWTYAMASTSSKANTEALSDTPNLGQELRQYEKKRISHLENNNKSPTSELDKENEASPKLPRH